MSIAELEKQYNDEKNEIDRLHNKYSIEFHDLIVSATNLIPVFEGYERELSSISSMRKDSVISNINLQLRLLGEYITQIQKFKNNLDESYFKSNQSARYAINTKQPGDAITAQGQYITLKKDLQNAPELIKQYTESITESRKSTDKIQKEVFRIMPMDTSGLRYKKIDDDEKNIELMMADKIVWGFLFIMIGLAVYYFAFMKFPDSYDYLDEEYKEVPVQMPVI